MKKAIGYFEQATKKAPEYALAYAGSAMSRPPASQGAARCRNLLGLFGTGFLGSSRRGIGGQRPDVDLLLCVLENPLLSPDFSLTFGHFDPPGCPDSSQ